ncbi:MAG TPA: integrin alpha [Planctomycetota bacterium]
MLGSPLPATGLQKRSGAAFLFAYLLLLPAAAATAQSPGGDWSRPFQFDGPAVGDQAGTAVASAGDVNNDGWDDVIVGMPEADPNGRAQAGSAIVYSGMDGSVLLRIDGTGARERLGTAVAGPGDLDGDGFDDLIVGAPLADPFNTENAGIVVAVSGATGAQLWNVRGTDRDGNLGSSVAALGDVDGDLIPDVAIGAPGNAPQLLRNAGAVAVVSGADGSLIRGFRGPASLARFGFAVAGVGDLDRDGLPDLLVGAPTASPGGRSEAGSVYVLSPATGATIHEWHGEYAGILLGFSVASAGDLNFDGFDEVIAGAPFAPAPPGGLMVGAAVIWGGRWGAVRNVLQTGASFDRFGWRVAGVGDANGDGFPDLAVAAPFVDGAGDDRGRVVLLAGDDLRVLNVFDGEGDKDTLGFGLGHGTPAPGGLARLFLGAPRATRAGLTQAGTVRVEAYDPFLRTDAHGISSAAGGSATLAVDFPYTEAGAEYLLLATTSGAGVVSLGGLEIPLKPDAVFTMTRRNQYPPLFTNPRGTLDAGGNASIRFQLPPGGLSSYVGTLVHFAVISYRPPATPGLSSGPVAVLIKS